MSLFYHSFRANRNLVFTSSGFLLARSSLDKPSFTLLLPVNVQPPRHWQQQQQCSGFLPPFSSSQAVPQCQFAPVSALSVKSCSCEVTDILLLNKNVLCSCLSLPRTTRPPVPPTMLAAILSIIMRVSQPLLFDASILLFS